MKRFQATSFTLDMINTCRKPLLIEQKLNKIGTRLHKEEEGGGQEGGGE